MNDKPQQSGLWDFMDDSNESECEPGNQEDFSDILARSTKLYDPRFNYTNGGPQWKDDCQRKRWIALRKRLASTQDWKCYYCETPITLGNMHIDHKQPVSRNGTHKIGNLCACCATCNLSKAMKTEEEFRGLFRDRNTQL